MLIEQCLMLNRRRNDDDSIPEQQDIVQRQMLLNAEPTPEDSVSVAPSVIDPDKIKIGGGVSSRIYVCATLWHETANEMVQVLKSIMRLS